MSKTSHQTTEEKYRVLLDINNEIITNRDRESLFEDVTEALRSILPFDRANIMLYLPEEEGFRPFYALVPRWCQSSIQEVETEHRFEELIRQGAAFKPVLQAT